MSAVKKTAKDYPLFAHFYGSDGSHLDPVRIEDKCGLLMIMKGRIYDSIKAGNEVRITDIDDFTVFYALDGRIVFPEGGNIEYTRQA